MVRPVPILIADGHAVSNAQDLFRPPPWALISQLHLSFVQET
jgi:hypothetical protein